MTLSDNILKKAEETMAHYPNGTIFAGSPAAKRSLESARTQQLHPQTQRLFIKPTQK